MLNRRSFLGTVAIAATVDKEKLLAPPVVPAISVMDYVTVVAMSIVGIAMLAHLKSTDCAEYSIEEFVALSNDIFKGVERYS